MQKKGLKNDARRVLEAVTAKVAETHGFKLGEMEELSLDEMQAVAGGFSDCSECIEFSFRVWGVNVK